MAITLNAVAARKVEAALIRLKTAISILEGEESRHAKRVEFWLLKTREYALREDKATFLKLGAMYRVVERSLNYYEPILCDFQEEKCDTVIIDIVKLHQAIVHESKSLPQLKFK